MIQPHFDLLRSDCCFQDHGQRQSRSGDHGVYKPQRSLSTSNTIQTNEQHRRRTPLSIDPATINPIQGGRTGPDDYFSATVPPRIPLSRGFPHSSPKSHRVSRSDKSHAGHVLQQQVE